MKTDGYMLRDALKAQALQKEAAEKAFKGSLHKFEDEKKLSPQEVVDRLRMAELAIAKLQVAQMRYNLAVEVKVAGETMTLADAIKRIGAVGRAEKMWRSVTPPVERRSYMMDDIDPTRDPNQVRAKRTIETDEAVALAAKAGKLAGQFRAAIAKGNAQEIEIENLDPALFE